MFTNRGEQPELRPKLVSPHDSCTVLAQELNGTVWTVHDGSASVEHSSSLPKLKHFPYSLTHCAT